MDTIRSLPFFMLEFDKDGDLKTKGPLFPNKPTDLLVLSHGWKNDRKDAETLYTGFVEGMLAASGGVPAGRSFAVVGVSWPAFRYGADLSLLPDNFGGEDETGAAAGIGGPTPDIEKAKLKAYARDVARILGIDADHFEELADQAATKDAKADQLAKEVRDALTQLAPASDARAEHGRLFEANGRTLLADMALPPMPDEILQAHDAGEASNVLRAVKSKIKGWYNGGRAMVARMLNQFTYYEMKARAGTVGEELAKLLDESDLKDVRLHFVGHSFGARLVTSAANRLIRKLDSLTLLQGAFSHNGFCAKNPAGAFRDVVGRGKVDGPILITHTHNDTAVGFFYAIASFASGEDAASITASIGGPKDRFGGLGANGAQRLDKKAVWLTGAQGVVPAAVNGIVTNILADSFIENHNDVGAEKTGAIIWAAVKG